MAEHSFPISGFVPNGSAEPVEEIASDGITNIDDLIQATGPRVDTARGVFITSKGNEIELSDKPLNALIVMQISRMGKPQIPMVEVTLVGKHKQLEPHPNDAGYLALLEQWREEAELRTGTYMFNVGVKGQPPQDFVDEHAPFFPDATQAEMKYLWVCSQLPLEDVNIFTECLISRSTPTAKGLEEVANFTE